LKKEVKEKINEIDEKIINEINLKEMLENVISENNEL